MVPESIDKPVTPLIVIVGPTAVGKTETAIQLAERLHGEIISADSRLFYRGMDIGTAKPTQADRARVQHHLIDIVYPDQVISLAMYQKAVQGTITNIARNGHVPFLVGGTGQYIRAVVEAWDVPRTAPNPALRLALNHWAKHIGPAEIHKRLAKLDPMAASQIDYRNLRRTVRALEVIFTTGKLFSRQKRKSSISNFHSLILGLDRPRPELYDRIDTRIRLMLDAGFVEEVRDLLDKGYSPDLPAFSAIGYREIIAYLQDKISLDEAVVLIKRHTRIFVRRQSNWFKRADPNIRWHTIGPGIVQEMELQIKEFLAGFNYKL